MRLNSLKTERRVTLVLCRHPNDDLRDWVIGQTQDHDFTDETCRRFREGTITNTALFRQGLGKDRWYYDFHPVKHDWLDAPLDCTADERQEAQHATPNQVYRWVKKLHHLTQARQLLTLLEQLQRTPPNENAAQQAATEDAVQKLALRLLQPRPLPYPPGHTKERLVIQAGSKADQQLSEAVKDCAVNHAEAKTKQDSESDEMIASLSDEALRARQSGNDDLVQRMLEVLTCYNRATDAPTKQETEQTTESNAQAENLGFVEEGEQADAVEPTPMVSEEAPPIENLHHPETISLGKAAPNPDALPQEKVEEEPVVQTYHVEVKRGDPPVISKFDGEATDAIDAVEQANRAWVAEGQEDLRWGPKTVVQTSLGAVQVANGSFWLGGAGNIPVDFSGKPQDFLVWLHQAASKDHPEYLHAFWRGNCPSATSAVQQAAAHWRQNAPDLLLKADYFYVKDSFRSLRYLRMNGQPYDPFYRREQKKTDTTSLRAYRVVVTRLDTHDPAAALQHATLNWESDATSEADALRQALQPRHLFGEGDFIFVGIVHRAEGKPETWYPNRYRVVDGLLDQLLGNTFEEEKTEPPVKSKIRQRECAYHVELMSPHEDQIEDPVRNVWNGKARSNRDAVCLAWQLYAPVFDLPFGSIALVGRAHGEHPDSLWENWSHTRYVVTQKLLDSAASNKLRRKERREYTYHVEICRNIKCSPQDLCWTGKATSNVAAIRLALRSYCDEDFDPGQILLVGRANRKRKNGTWAYSQVVITQKMLDNALKE
jgi:hypothetical protein